MRHVPTLRGLRPRKLVPAFAVGAVALAGAVAPPVQAAGPPQTIDKEVEMNCTLVTPFFSVPNLQLFVRVHATVPSFVTPSDNVDGVYIQESYAEIRIPPTTAGALSVVSADTVDGVADVFNLALTNADPAVVNVTEDPVAYGPQLVPPGTETIMRVPNSGTLPDVGPIRAAASAEVGDVIEARLIRLETQLHATSSTNPQIDQNLPFFCDNAAGADNLVSSIPIQADEVDPPAITGITPTEGDVAGGTEVTITGTGFTGATGVAFGGTDAASFEVVSDTEITAVSPAGAVGTVDVVVTGPEGSSENTAADDFTYTEEEPPPPLPAITGIAPTSGDVAGGTEVTITGTAFTDVSGVSFGGTPATSFEVVSAEEITAVAPAGAVGSVDVVVTTSAGASENTAADDFTYTEEEPPPPAPAVSGIAPSEGDVAGGTEVTITGTGFTGATGVAFGGTDAASFEVVSDTEITAVSPAGAVGTVDVVVTGPEGSSENTAADDFTYTEEEPPPPAPAVSGIAPSEGDVAGGTEVTITGTGFTGATGVAFGGTDATSFEVVSDTSITAVSPAGAAGTVDVVVTGPEGSSENTPADDFTYTEEEPPPPVVPAVSGIAPSEGDVAGGTAVTITGTGFTGATGVAFGANPATSFEVVSDTSITAVSPAGAAGTVDVVVTGPEGSSENTAADDFTYTEEEPPPPAEPVVSGVSPNSGPQSGGNTVVISGTGLAGATKVRFGSNVTPILSNTGTEITVKAPAGTGTVDVRVVVDGVTSRNSSADDYTYSPDTPPIGKNPTVKKLFPDVALAYIGGITIVKGTNLDTTKKVTVGGRQARFFKVSKTELIVLLPGLKRGTYDLVVTNKSGTSATNAASKIRYISLW